MNRETISERLEAEGPPCVKAALISRREAISLRRRVGAIKRKIAIPGMVWSLARARAVPLILHKRAFKRSTMRFARFLLSSAIPTARNCGYFFARGKTLRLAIIIISLLCLTITTCIFSWYHLCAILILIVIPVKTSYCQTVINYQKSLLKIII